jgi:glycosyltransferase involved in cell wall biosynthesis
MENISNNKKRIALVIWELDLCGGTQRLMLELAQSLAAKGHNIHVFAHYFDQNKGFTDKFVGLKIFGVTNMRPVKSMRKNGPLRMFVKIYYRVIKAYFLPEKESKALAHLIKTTSAGIPYDCLNMHDYEAYKVARLLRYKNMVWTMNDIQRPPLGGKSWIHNTLFNFLQRAVAKREIRHIRDIIVLDNRNKKLCQEYYNRQSTVVRGGMDVHMFDGKHIIKNFNKDVYNIFLSSIFFPWRRFEDAIDAADILIKRGKNNFKMHINGIPNRAPKYFESIQKRIINKGLSEYIHITPGLKENDLVAEYVRSDIFIFPNNNQTWGLAVFEAMLAGCATIVSMGSGASEILTDGENALLVPPLSPDRIAVATETLLTNPRALEKLSLNGSNFVKENLSWDRYATACYETFFK